MTCLYDSWYIIHYEYFKISNETQGSLKDQDDIQIVKILDAI